ncbi:hypothetical protein MFIFM68171_03834 [Madurella fahalii]|uniref:Uncharacterized protein n=1 Tax=Madurella fahalii TaxID=1157608 RepID=A0ABQ0G790_9PEZI
MPKQYVVCGRPVPRLGTRHISLLLVGLALFALFSLLFTLPSTIPAGPSLQAAGHKFSFPNSLQSPWITKLNPFKQPSHAPPRQKNDTDGDSWWYADWKWLSMPFSSSITLDENRALLPILEERTPIYCYYDNTADRDQASKDADSDLLLTWRRAWWAQGLKPIILSPAEAMDNPLYEEVQKLPDLKPSLKTDLMRWLAWEKMAGGVLAHHLLFPMGPHDDPVLTFLRHGEFPKLTRWKNLDDGLFVGPKGEVGAAIKQAMAAPNLKELEDFLTAVESSKKESPFVTDDASQSLAYYSAQQIDSKYAKVGEAINLSRATGLKSLIQLINSHLHTTWRNLFSDGIAVLKPLPAHTTHLITPAYELAQRLAHCPETPLPKTCPPNRPSCTPCDDAKPLKITTPSSYTNTTTTIYTIGTVPHPYTISTLTSLRPHLDIAWIRRSSPRDPWITDLTASLFPDRNIPSAPRVVRFKEAVASASSADSDSHNDHNNGNGAAYRSLWLPAEQSLPDDLDWHFGFALPDGATYADDTSTSTTTTTTTGSGSGSGSGKKPNSKNSPDGDKIQPTEKDLQFERDLFASAQAVVLATHARSNHHQNHQASSEDLRLRDAVEAWNLADTEAWRFARAYLARKTVERLKWEEEEAKYAGGVGTEKKRKGKKEGSGWGRWLDRS